MSERFFAPCPRGLEAPLAAELAELGAREVEPLEAGAAFRGDFYSCYRINRESRIASRVLWQVAEGPYESEHDLYELARTVPWPDYFRPDRTVRVYLAATRSPLKSLNFATLRIKDGLCDEFRRRDGVRPSVDTRAPDVRVYGYLTEDRAMLYLDTSGEALFKRGWRRATGDAPLKENLAAGILRLAGWTPDLPLFDPMCGPGTFLLEAATAALSIAPGSGRRFGFEKLANFDGTRLRRLEQESAARTLPARPPAIHGSDLYGSALDAARANLAAAGVADAVNLKQANVLEVSPPGESGVVVTNPPYGVRLGETDELARFYPLLGDALKRRFAGWRVFVFTADLRLPKLIRLAPRRRIPLFNGALECRLLEYPMVAGSARKSP